jgi:manganese transport protein
MFTSRRDLMGSLVNTKLTTVLASLSGAIILLLNIVLLYLVFAPLLGWWQPS